MVRASEFGDNLNSILDAQGEKVRLSEGTLGEECVKSRAGRRHLHTTNTQACGASERCRERGTEWTEGRRGHREGGERERQGGRGGRGAEWTEGHRGHREGRDGRECRAREVVKKAGAE